MIDIEILRERIEADVQNHLDGITEIFSSEECDKIATERDLNIIGIINGLATTVVTSSDDFKKIDMSETGEVTAEILSFVDRFSKMVNTHPIDSIFYSIKMLSDVLIQLTIIEEEEGELEHE